MRVTVRVRIKRIFSVRGWVRVRVRVHIEAGIGVGLGLRLGFVLVESRFWVRLRVRRALWIIIQSI